MDRCGKEKQMEVQEKIHNGSKLQLSEYSKQIPYCKLHKHMFALNQTSVIFKMKGCCKRELLCCSRIESDPLVEE